MINNLSTREKYILAFGGVFVGAVLLYLGIIAPFRTKLDLLERKIAAGRSQLEQSVRLQQEYQLLERQVRQISALQKDSSAGLLSFIENQVQRAAGRDKLVAMRPMAPVRHDAMIEEAVDIKLERITLQQMVTLLQHLEQARRPLRVKTLDLKVRFENRSLFDAALIISTFNKG